MSKGVGNKALVGTNSCVEKSTQGCLAIKRKWVCSGACAFKYNFCCDYRMNSEESSLVLLYSSSHNHPMHQSDQISLDDCIKPHSESSNGEQRAEFESGLLKECAPAPSTLKDLTNRGRGARHPEINLIRGVFEEKQAEVHSTRQENFDPSSSLLEECVHVSSPLMEQEITGRGARHPTTNLTHGLLEEEEAEALSTPQEDIFENSGDDEKVDIDAASWIAEAIKCSKKYSKSKINFTLKTKISSTEMSDTFHIIKKKKEERAFDVSQDGYFYNRRTTTKEFPVFFKKQQTAVYTCPGRMKCINSECNIFKRLQCLSYIANKPSTSKKCLQCSADLILDQCSGKRWIISSSDKDSNENSKEANFVVAYYQNSHSCGKQDWVLDPAVIDDLSNWSERSACASATKWPLN